MKSELKNLRESHNQKIKDIAKFLDINRDTYSFYESDISNMKIKDFIKLCETYKVTPNYMLNYSSEIELTEEELIQIQKAINVIERKIKK